MKLLLLVLSFFVLFSFTTTSVSAAQSCNGKCSSNFDCATDYVCLESLGLCRGACNPSDSACGCVVGAAKTPVPTAQSTPRPIPTTGTSWTTFAMFGIGTLVVIGSLFLAL